MTFELSLDPDKKQKIYSGAEGIKIFFFTFDFVYVEISTRKTIHNI